MNAMDVIMSILFILFMIFVFGGYHKTKYKQREEQAKRDEEQKNNQEDSKV